MHMREGILPRFTGIPPTLDPVNFIVFRLYP
jgi:hypothetical protein